ncbi:MAG: DUF547 domain-containing protein [Chitinophagaceae bacterium]
MKSLLSFAFVAVSITFMSCQNSESGIGEMKGGRSTSIQTMNDSAIMGESPFGITNASKDVLSELSYAMLSANFVDRAIHNEDVTKHLAIFKSMNPDKLEDQLKTDALRRCFWINVYNGYTQYFLKKDPSLYKKDRSDFFKKDQIEIAGFTINMNDIEHGVLRRGATIWSKGYIRIPFRNEFVRKFKVDKVDWHIHFALNCGAKSCPPICVYLPERVDEQLDKAAASYLKKECSFNKKDNSVKVPALMTWFSADFGDTNAKLDILRKYGIIPADSNPSIDYKDYDWDMDIVNYKQF